MKNTISKLEYSTPQVDIGEMVPTAIICDSAAGTIEEFQGGDEYVW